MARHLNKHRQAGFALQDALMGMIVFLSLLPVFVYYQVQAAQEVEATAAAEMMTEVVDAAKRYLQDNAVTLQGAATATSAVRVDTPAMQAQGLLNPNGNYVNNFGQQHRLYVLQPTAGNLVGFVITYGGRGAPANTTNAALRTFADQIILSAAIKVGAAGGFVATGNLPSASVANRLYGAHGGWTYDLGPTDIPSPGPGHLASIIYLSDGELIADYLYRNAVPGNPEANRMNVAIDMNGNNIDNVDILDATTVWASDDVEINRSSGGGRASVSRGMLGWSGLFAHGQWGIPLPGSTAVACPTPSAQWKYIAIPINWRTPAGDGPAGGMRIRLQASGSSYRPLMQVLTESGWSWVETSAQAWVMVHCS